MIHYEVIFDNAPLGIIVVNAQGVIENVNPMFCTMMEYTKDELLHKRFLANYTNGKEDFFFSQIFESGLDFYQTELLLTTRSGRDIIVNALSSLINQNDTLSIVIMLEDITSKRQLEQEQKEQENLFVQQSKMAMMGEMVGAIAHQWRQPLNALRIYLNEIVDSYEYHELTHESLSHIMQLCDKQILFMNETIEDFRSFFKPKKESSQFNVASAIHEVLHLTRHSLDLHHIEVILSLTESLVLYGIANEFKQALINLLMNAKDAIIDSHAENKKIFITLQELSSSIVLTLEDTGGGISEESIPHLFTPHYTTKGEKGTGIGLYMTQLIIEKSFHAHIDVRNSHYGACFILTFPKKDLK